MREPAKSFEDVLAWKKAHQFVLEVYNSTKQYPSHELFGLTSQFRRAAISIPANIAEGFKKRGTKDKARFMNIAQGSLEECRYYIILSKDLDYNITEQPAELLEETSKLLSSYRNAILNSGS